VIKQFPNAAQYVKKSEQMLRNVQEVLADKEFRAGDFYFRRGAFPAAANRFAFLSQQYPLYSAADQALWEEADAYRKMGDRFETQEGDALTKIVKDYPLSAHVDEAKSRLGVLKRAVPQADPAAYARQKYELENRRKPGMISKSFGFFGGRPDVSLAAKSGAPAMESYRPPVPLSVPEIAAGGRSGVSDVVGDIVKDSSNLDKSPDARMSSQNGVVVPEGAGTGEQKASLGSNGETTAPSGVPGTPSAPAASGTAAATPAAPAPPPTNHPVSAKQMKDYQKAQARAQQKAAKLAKKKGLAPAAAGDAAKAETNAAVPAGTAPPVQQTGPPVTSPTTPGSPLPPHL
jgi:outer membrane protein assembly factor BamD